jgi:hypothetical protein
MYLPMTLEAGVLRCEMWRQCRLSRYVAKLDKCMSPYGSRYDAQRPEHFGVIG